MSEHNQPPPLEQISNTVTTSLALSANTLTEGSIDIGKTL